MIRASCFLLVLFWFSAASAEDKVVVIPLNSIKSTGDAQPSDVLSGKTFSNGEEIGLTGTLEMPTSDTCSGDAQPEDVVAGKTFSNNDQVGLTGTLVIPDTCLGDALPEDVLEGKTFSNDSEVGLTGTMPACLGDAQPDDVLIDKTFCNSDSTNITGTRYPSLPRATGQVSDHSSYDTTVYGTDGQLNKGVDWPVPRFTNNGDGTVTDNLTGLVWLKNAACFGQLDWDSAFSTAENLADGSCSLSDGSVAGDWRVPNIIELSSLLNYEYASPMVSNTNGDGQWSSGDPFTNVQNASYWTSTTMPHSSYNMFGLDLSNGLTMYLTKNTNTYYFWPVRDNN